MLKSGLSKIWFLFVVYFIIFILNFNFPISNNSTSDMWFWFGIYTLLISIYLIIKNGFPAKKYIYISLLLSVLAYLAYVSLGYYYSISQVIGFISTFLSTNAIFTINHKYGMNVPAFLKSSKKGGVVKSILIGVIVGAIWGVINFLLMKGSNEINISIRFSYLLISLSPAIIEEVVDRGLFYALALHILNGEIKNKKEEFVLWFMMIVPHVLPHMPGYYMDGIISGIINTVIVCLLFGLPFAFLQRKRDIFSAMIAHGMIDLIRFTIFGIPLV